MYKVMLRRGNGGLDFFRTKDLKSYLPEDKDFDKKRGGMIQVSIDNKRYTLSGKDVCTIDGVPLHAVYQYLAEDTEEVKGLKKQIKDLQLRIDEMGATIVEFEKIVKVSSNSDATLIASTPIAEIEDGDKAND